MFKSVIVVFLSLFLSQDAFGAIYYVDPATGNNCNDGLSLAGGAWRNLPGTRAISGSFETNQSSPASSGFWNESPCGSVWGTITQTNKVQCGDQIVLKPGTTQTSASGGSVLVDTTYYSNNCPTNNKITIRTANPGEWTGATGDFVFDFAGVVATCSKTHGFYCSDLAYCPGSTFFCDAAGGFLLGEDSIRVLGNGSSWIHFKNSTNSGMSVEGSSISIDNAEVSYVVFENNATSKARCGFDIGQATNFAGNHFVARDNGWCGIGIGHRFDNEATGYIKDALVEGNALTASGVAAANASDGIFATVSPRFLFIDVVSRNNHMRGANFGVIKNETATEARWLFRNFIAYGNGDRCNPTCTSGNNCVFCAGAGIDGSGDDNTTGRNGFAAIVKGVLFHNNHMGFSVYGGGQADLWNVNVAANGFARSDGSDLYYDQNGNGFAVNNSIIERRASIGKKAFGRQNSNVAFDVKPSITASILASQASSNTMSDFWFNGTTFTVATRLYSDTLGFEGTGVTKGVVASLFTATNDSVYDSNNWNLVVGSPAIDAGRCMFSANGAGTGAGTINLNFNTFKSDVRDYLWADQQFTGLTGDEIQIAGAVCSPAGNPIVGSMTATSITFAGGKTCTWANSACVSLPFAGALPDIGYVESGYSSPPTVTPTPILTATSTPKATTTPGGNDSLTFTFRSWQNAFWQLKAINATATPVLTPTPTATLSPTPTATGIPTATATPNTFTNNWCSGGNVIDCWGLDEASGTRAAKVSSSNNFTTVGPTNDSTSPIEGTAEALLSSSGFSCSGGTCTALTTGLTPSFTCTGFFTWDGSNTGFPYLIWNKEFTTNSGMALGFNSAANPGTLQGLVWSNNVQTDITIASAIASGVKTHFAFVYDSVAQKITIYKKSGAGSNLSALSAVGSYSAPNGSAPFQISPSFGRTNGKLDEFSCWKSALTATQICQVCACGPKPDDRPDASKRCVRSGSTFTTTGLKDINCGGCTLPAAADGVTP